MYKKQGLSLRFGYNEVDNVDDGDVGGIKRSNKQGSNIIAWPSFCDEITFSSSSSSLNSGIMEEEYPSSLMSPSFFTSVGFVFVFSPCWLFMCRFSLQVVTKSLWHTIHTTFLGDPLEWPFRCFFNESTLVNVFKHFLQVRLWMLSSIFIFLCWNIKQNSIDRTNVLLRPANKR